MNENTNENDLNGGVNSQEELPTESKNNYPEFTNEQNETTEQENSYQSTPDSLDQNYQSYEQKMKEQNLIPPYIQEDTGIKKKSLKGVVATVIIAVIILGVATSAFAFRDTLKNTFALMTKSPAEYYSSIEKDALNTTTNEFKTLAKMQNNLSEHVSADISINRDKVDSLLKQYSETGLTDIEDTLGIKLNNLGLEADVSKQDKYIYENIGLKLNNVNIITAEIFMDNLKQELFYKLPDLSPAFLKMSMNSIDESMATSTTLSAELSDPDKLTDFINRYCNIIIDQAKSVSLEKNAKLKTDNNSVKCNKLTVTLKNKDIQNISKAILKEAKNDDYILKILPLFKVSEKEYIKSIDESLAEVSNNKDLLNGKIIKMNVYVDNSGNIIGRDLITTETGKSNKLFSYALFNKKDKCEYSFILNDDASESSIELSGESTINKEVSDGKLTLDITSKQGLPITASINLTYKDARYVRINNQMYLYGKYTLSSPLLKGADITVDYDVDNDIQLCNMVVNMDKSSLVTIKSKMKYLKNFTIKKPSKSDKIYDVSEVDNYVSTLDIKKYVTDVATKLGIKQEFLDSYLPYLEQ